MNDDKSHTLGLQKRISNQRKTTRRLDWENKRMREFIAACGYDPDAFRFDDRTPPAPLDKSLLIDVIREANRRRDALASVTKHLDLGCPITARENARDFLGSMAVIEVPEQNGTGT